MSETNANVTDAVATVTQLFEDLSREWADESARIRTWHEITELSPTSR